MTQQVTGQDGTDSAIWLAGVKSGAYTLDVRSGTLPPLVIQADVLPDKAATVQIETDPSFKADATLQPKIPIRVSASVKDQYGNGIPQTNVTIDASRNCIFESTTLATDSAGTTPPIEWVPIGRGSCVLVAHLDDPLLKSKSQFRILATKRSKPK